MTTLPPHTTRCASGNHGFDNDDASATYDEVRIWGGALSDAQLTFNAKLGPDKIIVFPKEGVCGEVEVAAGATLATPTNGVTCTRLSGAGTLVAASALTVKEALDIAGTDTGTFTVNGDLTLTGDWMFSGGAAAGDKIVGTGAIDLTGATLVPDFAPNSASSYVIAEGVDVTGHEQMQMTIPKNIKSLALVDGKLYLKRWSGLVIIFK